MHFSLRKWSENDLESLVRYANNAKIARFMTDQFPHPYLAEHGRAFINFANGDSGSVIFAIDIAGEVVGGIGLHPLSDISRKNAELGYWLAEPFWGKGIITTAVIQMVDYAFNNMPITRVFARPFGSNVASQKVLSKAGFKIEATFSETYFKNGEYEDELVYAVRRPES